MINFYDYHKNFERGYVDRKYYDIHSNYGNSYTMIIIVIFRDDVLYILVDRRIVFCILCYSYLSVILPR